MRTAAGRTGKALGPAAGRQRLLALLLRAVAAHELRHRQAWLELDAVGRHASPPFVVKTSSQTASSPRELVDAGFYSENALAELGC